MGTLQNFAHLSIILDSGVCAARWIGIDASAEKILNLSVRVFLLTDG
jgi:hypothetical protein